MRIVCLTENTEGNRGCGTEHGLCFYIETGKHRVLMDTGASDLFLRNAEKLGVDLKSVDTVIVSHGHYDHGGGLPAFLEYNDKAAVYMQETAFGEYYSRKDEAKEPRYIGLDRTLAGNERIHLLNGDFRIDGELALFASIGSAFPNPSANRTLYRKAEDGLVMDDFAHEMCLAVFAEGKKILFSGCAHHGIQNILARWKELYHCDPDLVFSGFHMMKKGGYDEADITGMIDTAMALRESKTVFYTCHCTGELPYQAMKKILGNQLQYMHCGDELTLKQERKGTTYMKMHKVFAVATAVCFVITMITGYKKK